jgi:hypothetical protein
LSLADTEDALLWVQLEPIAPHVFEGFSQVSDVVGLLLTHDDDIVHVGRSIATQLIAKDSFIIRLKVDPALRRPPGILMKQKTPKEVVNPVFASSSVRIHTW